VKPAAEQLAEFALGLRLEEEVPAEVRHAARRHLLDALGCGLAAGALGEGDAARAVARQMAGTPEASLIGAPERVPAPSAALANGMLIHALDFDDTHAEAVAHVSAVVVPAALAAAEACQANGAELLTALIAGNEATVRIGAAASGEFHARGFHPTAVAGVFGAALAAARLHRADIATTASALGIAGSMASGLFAYLDDATATKPIHAGWAAHAGILAARLAAAGAEGPPHVLEGRFGLFDAFLGRIPELKLDDLGRSWETPRIAYKPYPACHYCHGALGAAAALDLDPAEVDAIVARVSPGAVDVVLEPQTAKLAPRMPYEAKFSLQHSLAALIVHGTVGTGTYTPEAIADPDTRALAARVHYEVADFPSPFGGAVEVTLRDGSVRHAELQQPAGSPENPLEDAAVLAKYRDNARLALASDGDDDGDDDDVAELEHVIETLEHQPDLTRLARILQLAASAAPSRV
jgi:2-methylcitrate dehydratase PrpD